jgi:hypothetical protein
MQQQDDEGMDAQRRERQRSAVHAAFIAALDGDHRAFKRIVSEMSLEERNILHVICDKTTTELEYIQHSIDAEWRVWRKV